MTTADARELDGTGYHDRVGTASLRQGQDLGPCRFFMDGEALRQGVLSRMPESFRRFAGET